MPEDLASRHVRVTAVDFLATNPRLPSGVHMFDFIEGDPREYLRHMERSGTWADHLIILSIAHAYNVNVSIHSNRGHQYDTVVSPGDGADEFPTIHLYHQFDLHFEAMPQWQM